MKSVGILGQGRFGSLLTQLLSPHFKVNTYDKHQNDLALLDQVLQQETVFIATPIRSFEQIVCDIANRLHPNALVIDVCSVKIHPATIMQKYLPESVDIIATHPLFGPDSFGDNNKKRMVFCGIRDQYRRYATWKHFFSQQDIQVIEMTPEQHDQMMAQSQGITHLIGRVLDRIQAKATPVDTAGYTQLLKIMQHTCNDSQELFQDLHHYNPYAKTQNRQLLSALQTILKTIEEPS